MPTAYVLINCTSGSEENIIKEVAKLPDVKEVRTTYGIHDVFVKVKSDSKESAPIPNLIANSVDFLASENSLKA